MNAVEVPRLPPERVTVCLCLTQARTPDVVLMAAACGFDSVYVDLEHAATSLDTASMLCITAAGAGMIPLVRVPSLDRELIVRLLDTGAHGIIVPHVADAATAAAVVRTCRFAPLGDRPPIGPNPVNRYRPGGPGDVATECDRATIVAVMIESETAVAQASAIAATPGLDLLIVGAWDLSASLGISQQFDHPRFHEGVATVAHACAASGKTLGLAGIADPALVATFIAAGVRFISVGTDGALFREAARDRIAALRAVTIHSTKEPS